MQMPSPLISANVTVSRNVWARWMSAYRLDAFSIANPTPACVACCTHGAIISQNRAAACGQRERAAAAGEHVDGVRADAGGRINQSIQGRSSVVRVIGHSTVGEHVGDGFDAVAAVLQQDCKIRVQQLAVQNAQPTYSQALPNNFAGR